MSKTEKIYKFINGDKFWYLVIMIATFIGGMVYFGEANADYKQNVEYKYYITSESGNLFYEFKTTTGTVCVTSQKALSCDFSGNPHAKP